MMDITRLKGLSYEALSKRGAELIALAHANGNWHSILDELNAIRDEMRLKVLHV